jgi:hypothetical protein
MEMVMVMEMEKKHGKGNGNPSSIVETERVAQKQQGRKYLQRRRVGWVSKIEERCRGTKLR